MSFNPRTHVGCDDRLPANQTALMQFQSTHPRRVRLVNQIMVFTGWQFQSTHPRRVRLHRRQPSRMFRGFNPRTHVGCDNFDWFVNIKTYSFNPRTHVGCDSQPFEKRTAAIVVSIHAPT